MQRLQTATATRNDVLPDDQAELIVNGTIYRYSRWDMQAKEFKYMEPLETVNSSLAYSPSYVQIFQLGKMQFYRRVEDAIL